MSVLTTPSIYLDRYMDVYRPPSCKNKEENEEEAVLLWLGFFQWRWAKTSFLYRERYKYLYVCRSGLSWLVFLSMTEAKEVFLRPTPIHTPDKEDDEIEVEHTTSSCGISFFTDRYPLRDMRRLQTVRNRYNCINTYIYIYILYVHRYTYICIYIWWERDWQEWRRCCVVFFVSDVTWRVSLERWSAWISPFFSSYLSWSISFQIPSSYCLVDSYLHVYFLRV